ncbi:MAG: AAA family ATPase [Candidatus Babeliaceae bacterium]
MIKKYYISAFIMLMPLSSEAIIAGIIDDIAALGRLTAFNRQMCMMVWQGTKKTIIPYIPALNQSEQEEKQKINPSNTLIIGGEIPEDIQEIVEFFNDVEKFSEIGAKMPKGILLVGPPGCGKTHLVRWIAQETGAELMYMAGSSFDEVFVGTGAARMRELFDDARSHTKAIIFIDEIDAIGGKRTGFFSSSHQNDTLIALLNEMDGYIPNNVLLIAATNIPESLDIALTRPGRFDRIIQISLPDIVNRKAILIAHAQVIKHILTDTDFEKLAENTEGFSAADLASLINEAAIFAVRNKATAVDATHIEKAIKKVIEHKRLQR